MTAVANRAIGTSDRFQRRLSSQDGRAMAGTSRVNREVYARFCGRLEVKFLRPTRRLRTPERKKPARLPSFAGSLCIQLSIADLGTVSAFLHSSKMLSK